MGGLVWGLGVETCRSSGGVADERKTKRVQFEPRRVLIMSYKQAFSFCIVYNTFGPLVVVYVLGVRVCDFR